MIPPPQVTYRLDDATWGHKFDPTQEGYQTEQVNNQIALFIVRCDFKTYINEDLWEEFQETFENWTNEHFQTADKDAVKDLRIYLVTHGVFVQRVRGNIGYIQAIMQALQEEEPHVWTIEEINANKGKGLVDETIGTIEPQQPRQTSQATQSASVRDQTIEVTPMPETRQHQTGSRYQTLNEGMSRVPQPLLRQEGFTYDDRSYQIREDRQESQPPPQLYDQTVDDRRATTAALINLIKVYTDDKKKYGGEPYDILNTKLKIFYDLCQKCGLPDDKLELGFSTMLKGKALDFYFEKIDRQIDNFVDMVASLRMHFETEETRQRYLTEWRETNLLRTIKKNSDKTRLECLELMLDNLRAAQKGLSERYQADHVLRDQALNACYGVPECHLALFKPAPTFEGLCADLRAAISTAARSKESSSFLMEPDDVDSYGQHFTDRTFGGQAKRYPPRPYEGNTSSFPRPQIPGSFRGKQSYGTQLPPGNGNGRPPKKCYVCEKVGCWSTRHTEQERKAVFSKTKETFTTSYDCTDEDIEAFLSAFEGEEEPPDPEHELESEATHFE